MLVNSGAVGKGF
jgi:aubergine